MKMIKNAYFVKVYIMVYTNTDGQTDILLNAIFCAKVHIDSYNMIYYL
jgi:hypothetical protein